MLATIKGYYDNGHIFLQEEAPVTSKTEVMVVFLKNEDSLNTSKKRTPGGLKDRVTIPDDFNDPIEDLKDYM